MPKGLHAAWIPLFSKEKNLCSMFMLCCIIHKNEFLLCVLLFFCV